MLLYVLYSTVYSELLYLYSSSITCTYFMYGMYGVQFRQVLYFIIYYSILVLILSTVLASHMPKVQVGLKKASE